MKTPLLNSIEKRPIEFAMIFLLVAALGMVFPIAWLDQLVGRHFAVIIVRGFFIIVGIVLMILGGQAAGLKFSWKDFKKNWDLVLVGVLVSIANFPIIALFRGDVTITASAGAFTAYVFFNIAVSMFEEIFFRGLIFIAFLIAFKDKKHGTLLAIFISSAVFGLVHFLNLFNSSVGFVFMQVGYSFLLGLLWTVLYYATKTIWVPVFCHALFNIGGLLVNEGIAAGRIWNGPTIAIIAVNAALGAIWVSFRLACILNKKQPEDKANKDNKESREVKEEINAESDGDIGN